MFEDLDWKSAMRRAAVAAALYLLFIYVMSIAFPATFGAGINVVSALVVAVAFFLLYMPVFAFSDRRKRRRLAAMKAEKKGGPGARGTARSTRESDATEEEEAGPGNLKGRHNPNTSRRKASRRRRR